ncbi:MAG: proliferating cell nuclear antigen (pcna) [Candidatus Aenigmarchaeota archaeon]|nr:proliferating cell nuclear antigen (pcna) [Candidatus Aenigmarchaeota archaeon]
MFKAEITDAKLLRDSLDAVSELIDEAELSVSPEGMRIVASDRAVVAVVNFFISKNAFDSYECDKEASLGINLTSMMQILRRWKDEKMTISAEENKITLSFAGKSRRNFTLPVIDVSKEESPDLAKLESGFTATIAVNSDAFSSGIEDAELVGDSVVFTVRKDIFILNSENDSSSTRLEMLPGESLNIMGVAEPVRARYSIDYMKKMLKARKLSETAKLSLSSEYPLRLSFSVPEKLELSFILAPRVEES